MLQCPLKLLQQVVLVLSVILLFSIPTPVAVILMGIAALFTEALVGAIAITIPIATSITLGNAMLIVKFCDAKPFIKITCIVTEFNN
jgi:hypothetical protein